LIYNALLQHPVCGETIWGFDIFEMPMEGETWGAQKETTDQHVLELTVLSFGNHLGRELLSSQIPDGWGEGEEGRESVVEPLNIGAM
jgi:hypothetical protein